MKKFAEKYKRNEKCGGFILERAVSVNLFNAFFYELKHEKTGAKYIHIENKDKENTFAVGFKTVPENSTGVAHILEHIVLCGSDRYPVRDPFFSMLKRSLNTFMNAFTASDRTVYPFCTQNKKDFFNLMSVYMDAVFFPKISETSFKQEGWRLEFDEEDELVYRGVVYNEMKGAMSSPDEIMDRNLIKAVCPLTTYANNSGGEPYNIPDLTYEYLKKFHKRYYHPSNSFFYSYGSFPLEDNLKFANDILKPFDAINPETEVLSQPRWEKEREFICGYPISLNENPEKKYQACIAWLTADINDTFEILVLTILDIILLSTQASPLYKALIDSDLGSTLSDAAGFMSDNKDTIFACGLKDIEKSSAKKIEKIIIDTLSDLAENGIDEDLINAAIHQIEFGIKEVTNHPYPYGLKLLLSFYGTWFHGGDVASVLEIDNYLKKIYENIEKERFFERKIKEYFLDNKHRVLFILEPDKEMERKENKKIVDKLFDIKKRLFQRDIEEIKKNTELLDIIREQKEDVSCLPSLEIADIEPGIKKTKEDEFDEENELFCYDKDVSGISYFSSVIGAANLEKRLLNMLPFFCYVFTKIGTKKRDYTKILKDIELYTGGLGLDLSLFSMFDMPDTCFPALALKGKCLVKNQTKMFELMTELLTCFTAERKERLKSLIMEYRANLESMIVHNGHNYAISLASRNLSKKCAMNEMLNGISHLHYIKDITDKLDSANLDKIAENMQEIADKLFLKNNIKMAVISEDKYLRNMKDMALFLKHELSSGDKNGFSDFAIQTDNKKIFEGFSTSSSVSFSAAGFKTVSMPHKDAPALLVISNILRLLYLHKEIREKGGAYGGFSIYDVYEGIFNFASYRDPHIIDTLSVFSKARDFIKNPENYTDEDVKEAILQACSVIDKPETPAAAKKAFFRKLIKLPDTAREEFKKELISIDKKKVLNAADKYFNENDYDFAVISNADKLNEANNRLSEKMVVKEI